MLKKIQWHKNLTVDKKITIYKTVLDILGRAGGSMDFNDFMMSIFEQVDFSKMEAEKALFELRAIIQELIKRGYIRFELRELYLSRGGRNIVPLVNVVRI